MDRIQERRKELWNRYYENLKPLAETRLFSLPDIPDYATNNAHLFYLVCRNLEDRTKLIKHLKDNGIQAVFHYLALHRSDFYCEKHDGRALPFCDRFSDCLVRLPMFFELDVHQVDQICYQIRKFFE
jgi:dTDP-4-amino-4,6-dideoxygalactose transaminase